MSSQRIGEHFTISVPFARAINPVTKTNWEGVGVKPDVNVAASEALMAALRLFDENRRPGPTSRLRCACATDRTKLLPFGIRVAELRPEQAAILVRLLEVYLGWMAEPLVATRRAAFERTNFGEVTFAWAGSTRPGEPHYYRIQSFLIEYDNAEPRKPHPYGLARFRWRLRPRPAARALQQRRSPALSERRARALMHRRIIPANRSSTPLCIVKDVRTPPHVVRTRESAVGANLLIPSRAARYFLTGRFCFQE